MSAIRAAGSAAGAAGRAYNIGGGDPISLNAALERLAAIAGRPLDVSRAERESGDVLHTAADVSRASAELGFAPATGLAEGLQAEFEWVPARAERTPSRRVLKKSVRRDRRWGRCLAELAGWRSLSRRVQAVWAASRRPIGLRLTRAAVQAACRRALRVPM